MSDTPNVIWSIYIELDDQMLLRDVFVDVPLEQVYEAAAKYCRDEGWDHVAIQRRLHP